MKDPCAFKDISAHIFSGASIRTQGDNGSQSVFAIAHHL
jgi:hypothetical protein